MYSSGSGYYFYTISPEAKLTLGGGDGDGVEFIPQRALVLKRGVGGGRQLLFYNLQCGHLMVCFSIVSEPNPTRDASLQVGPGNPPNCNSPPGYRDEFLWRKWLPQEHLPLQAGLCFIGTSAVWCFKNCARAKEWQAQIPIQSQSWMTRGAAP